MYGAKKLGTFSDPLLDRQIEEIIHFLNRPVLPEPGAGVIVRTPDGAKLYRLSVSDAGAVVATDVTAEFA
jgi:hypothetical protein